MKKMIAVTMFAAFAAALFCAQAFADTAPKDISTLLPKDTALVVGVDMNGLLNSDAYGVLEDKVLANVPDYPVFQSFFAASALKPYVNKTKGIVESGLTEVILVKRGLDTSKDNTSAILIGVFRPGYLDLLSKRMAQRFPDKVTITPIEEAGKTVYAFKGIFQKDETLYAVELKDHNLAVALTKQEALDYLARDAAAPEAAAKPADEIIKGIAAVRPGSTIWGVAYISDEKRKQFKDSKDPDETMLQSVKSVTMKMSFISADEAKKAAEAKSVDAKATIPPEADISVNVVYASPEIGDAMLGVVTKLRDKVVQAFDKAALKDLFNQAAIIPHPDSRTVEIGFKADKPACEALADEFADLLGVKPKPEEAAAPGEAVPAPAEGGAPAPVPAPAEGGTTPPATPPAPPAGSGGANP